MTDDRDLTITDAIDRTAVEPVVREGVIVLGLVVLTVLGTFLPGTDHELPGTEITVGDAVIGLGTLGIVVSLLHGVAAVRDPSPRASTDHRRSWPPPRRSPGTRWPSWPS